jgi:hypothetical protein
MRDPEFYYSWLKTNMGKYEIQQDNTMWTTDNGTKVLNTFSMTYKGVYIAFTAELGLEGCIDVFIAYGDMV